MIYSIFNMIAQAFSLAWNTVKGIISASGMTFAVFIGFIVTMFIFRMFINGLKHKVGSESADSAKGGK